MKIALKQFEGPLDLLLQLIQEEKLDITQIALAQVTEQFLQHLRSLTDLRPQELADWLVIASKLLVIKSKALMPSLSWDEEEEADAASLAWQLYQYKRYKEAAKYIKQLDLKNRQSWGRQVTFVDQVSFYPDPSVNPSVLQNAMKHIANTLSKITQIPKKVLEEVVTISQKIEELQNLIAAKVETKLKDLVASASSKTEVIVTFLAMLEMVKQKILSVDQEAIFADIVIKKRSDE